MDINTSDILKTSAQTTENTPSVATTSAPISSADFQSFMLTALGGDSKTEVNEEELFAAVIEQRLGDVSEEAAELYASEKEKFLSSMRRPDGYVSIENAAHAALKSVTEAGLITTEDEEKIYSDSFESAQLDENLSELWDGRGSENDPTISLMSMQDALAKAYAAISNLGSGEAEETEEDTELDPEDSLVDETAVIEEQAQDGAEGFLWKPVSESDGNLVVLLPTDLKGLIDKVEIHTELPPDETTKLGEGVFSGDEHNGARPHFRFDAPGSSYGTNIHVVAYRSDGETMSWLIGDGAERQD